MYIGNIYFFKFKKSLYSVHKLSKLLIEKFTLKSSPVKYMKNFKFNNLELQFCSGKKNHKKIMV